MPKNSAASAVELRRDRRGAAQLDAAAILQALPQAVLAVDSSLTIRFVGAKAEEFFDVSAVSLLGRPLERLLPGESAIAALARQAFASGASIAESGLHIELPRLGEREVTVQVAPIGLPAEFVAIALRERSIADKLDRQWTHRSAARSVTAMASTLAHEIRNPLLSIRGAAQLLEQGTTTSGDRELTRLICDEVDRLKALVDRMELFSDEPSLPREAINVHEVLGHVRKVAGAGFARHLRVIERYDPSLPPVDANRDQLIRLFLNLVKNAAEAAPAVGGEIVLSTAYQQGLRLTLPGTGNRVHLPLVVTVTDNGPGIPDEIRPHLFDAFVTTKTNGTGLGLALVAKIAADNGGIVEFDSRPGRTVFRVSLPVADENLARASGDRGAADRTRSTDP
jgi:two-component system nitrogen regulation sensor histidine kinase GlnL